MLQLAIITEPFHMDTKYKLQGNPQLCQMFTLWQCQTKTWLQ